jgi:prepilin-type N-terminal cleavage/methylation domain-containing protein
MFEEVKIDPLGRREMAHLSFQHVCKGMKGTMRGYTLIEVAIVLVIVLVLSSFGIYLYKVALAYAKDTVCQTNLDALETAVQLYAEENDALPASLGHLKLEHVEKGYAKAMEGSEWPIKAYTFLIKLDTSDHAYAQFLTYENLKDYGVTESIFHCPADLNGGVSYGINANLEDKNWIDVGGDDIVVADCDNHVFHSVDELAKRHDYKALTITKKGEIVEVDEEKPLPGGGESWKWMKRSHYPKKKHKKVKVVVGSTSNSPTNLEETVKHFDDLVNKNLNTSIADKAEDVRNKLRTALSELSKSPPDVPAAKGNIAGARGDLQAMIDGGLIDPEEGLALMDLFSDISSQLQ